MGYPACTCGQAPTDVVTGDHESTNKHVISECAVWEKAKNAGTGLQVPSGKKQKNFVRNCVWLQTHGCLILFLCGEV